MASNRYQELVEIANRYGFTVTSTTGGEHNTGSRHYRGLAIDVRTRDKTPEEVERFIEIARNRYGVRVRDERTHPAGQRVWSGPHLHLEIDEDQELLNNPAGYSSLSEDSAIDNQQALSDLISERMQEFAIPSVGTTFTPFQGRLSAPQFNPVRVDVAGQVLNISPR